MIVACNGLYFVLLFKIFMILSINASTPACCCLDRSLSEYYGPFLCRYLNHLAILAITAELM
jgi:hypothetical protein